MEREGTRRARSSAQAADGPCGGLQQERCSRGAVRRGTAAFVVDAGGDAAGLRGRQPAFLYRQARAFRSSPEARMRRLQGRTRWSSAPASSMVSGPLYIAGDKEEPSGRVALPCHRICRQGAVGDDGGAIASNVFGSIPIRYGWDDRVRSGRRKPCIPTSRLIRASARVW